MRSVLLASISLALGIVLLITWLYPVNADFWFSNPGWNGLGDLARSRRALEIPLAELAALDPRNYTALIVGPSRGFTPREVQAVRAFLSKGGRVVIADDFGTANELLEALGAPVRLARGLLADPLLNLGARELPLAYWSGRRLALNYATALNITGCSSCKVLAASSFFSYLDLNANGAHDEGEPAGPLPVAVSLSFRGGELVVISDSSIFINSMIRREGNSLFLELLLRSTTPAVVNSHWEETTLVVLKAALGSIYRTLSSPELKYPIAAAGPLGLVALRRQRELAERLKKHVAHVARAVEVQGA